MNNIYISISFLIVTLLVTTNFSQNSLSFDGTNDHVVCGNSTAVQITGNSISLEAWIYPTSWKTNIWEGNIINKEAPGAGYMLRCGAGGKLNFNLGSGPWNELSSTTNVLTLNTWQHIAGTYDGSYMRIYVNGVIVDSIAKSISISNSTSSLCIGEGVFYGGRHFPGKIDEVRVWNAGRTKAQLNANMNQELCTIPSSLKAYYTFNQGIAGGTNTFVTSLIDLSGNSNTGTLTNFGLTGTTSNWVAGVTLTPGIATSSFTVSTCGTYTMPNGTIVSTSGTYYDTSSTVGGCDSLIAYSITFSSAHISNSYSYSSCLTYTMPNGRVISSSGTYYDTLSASGSCDTLDSYLVTISAGVDDSVYQTGNKLTSVDTWAPSHQWVNCNTSYSPITGETNKIFTPTNTGSYAVIVTRGSCVDTSDCFSIVINNASINEKLAGLYSIYPNPANESIYISSLYNLKIQSVTIFDVTGKVALTVTNNFNSINISKLSDGIYTIKLDTKDGSSSKRFVKN